MAVSFAAVNHTVKRLELKEDFGRAFVFLDVAMLVLAHRHKWTEFLQCMCYHPMNYNFMCMGATRLLEIHGDVEAYEFIMSFIPDEKVEQFRIMFKQLNFVCFPSENPSDKPSANPSAKPSAKQLEKRVRFAV